MKAEREAGGVGVRDTSETAILRFDLDHCGFLLNLKRVSCVCTHNFDVRRDHPVFPFTVSLTSERDL